MNQLGRLEPVNPREVWADEARDFTPWLAKEENISLLGEAIGIELEVQGTEQNVGPFKADILCKDTVDDHFVLIENQLEKTNHTHLGQLMTYAAGLHAASIVWIADQFRDEHRAAMDWLNEITKEEIRFFGLEVEVWKIGSSKHAPKFNIVSKPNDWSKSSPTTSGTGELSDLKALQQKFWQGLRELLDQSSSPLKGTRPRPQHWNNYAIGRSKFGMHASMNTQAGFARTSVSLRGPDREAHFRLLEQDRDEIETEFGATLEWEELPGKKVKRISIHQNEFNFDDQANWDNYFRWLKDHLEKLDQVFRPRIRNLDASEYEEIQNEDGAE